MILHVFHITHWCISLVSINNKTENLCQKHSVNISFLSARRDRRDDGNYSFWSTSPTDSTKEVSVMVWKQHQHAASLGLHTLAHNYIIVNWFFSSTANGRVHRKERTAADMIRPLGRCTGCQKVTTLTCAQQWEKSLNQKAISLKM